MNQEKIGKYIREIRKNKGLTQQELADKLGVSFQAVSKWERGICIPDIALLKEISKLFDVNVDEILEGGSNNIDNGNNKYIDKEKENKIVYYVIVGIIVTLIICLIMFLFNREDHDFEFKQISTSCDNFNITGSMAYNKDKTSLYISSVEFCGSDDNEIYQSIGCTLYEDHENIENKISTCNSSSDITLKEYLKDVRISVDNYDLSCDSMLDSELYLEISATTDGSKEIVYKIPITLLENSCNN